MFRLCEMSGGQCFQEFRQQISQQQLMGNNSSSSEVRKEFHPVSSRISAIPGQPYLVRSNKTGLELEEYMVSGSEREIFTDSHIYALRSSSYTHNLAVVYHHFVLNESEKIFLVRTEKMVSRLNQLSDSLTDTEAFCILQACLNGYAELLRYSKAPFPVTDRMISLNQKGQVRVWANENYALNRTQNGLTVRSEGVMVSQTYEAVESHLQKDCKMSFESFKFILQQCPSLFDAKMKVTSKIGGIDRKKVFHELKIRLQQHKKTDFQSEKISMKSFEEIEVHQEKKNSVSHHRKFVEELQTRGIPEKKKNSTPLNKQQGKRDETPTPHNRKKIFVKKQAEQLKYRTNNPLPERFSFQGDERKMATLSMNNPRNNNLNALISPESRKYQSPTKVVKKNLTPNKQLENKNNRVKSSAIFNAGAGGQIRFNNIPLPTRINETPQMIKFNDYNARKVEVKKTRKISNTFENYQASPVRFGGVQQNKSQEIIIESKRSRTPTIEPLSPTPQRRPLQKVEPQSTTNNDKLKLNYYANYK